MNSPDATVEGDWNSAIMGNSTLISTCAYSKEGKQQGASQNPFFPGSAGVWVEPDSGLARKSR